jgi:hypothetical protein
MKLNNNPPPDVTSVQITDERLTFGLEDGRTVSVPLSFYPTLQLATRRERADFGPSSIATSAPTACCVARRKPAGLPSAPGAKRASSPPPESHKTFRHCASR